MINVFYSFVSGAALLLSVMCLWFTSIMPGIDRWNKRFFQLYFAVLLMACCLSVLELLCQLYYSPFPAIYLVLTLESLLILLPFPMLTIYLLHCCSEDLRKSRLFHIVLGLWGVCSVIIFISPFIDGFLKIMPDGQYYREPLYPILLLPAVMIMLLNLAEAIRHKERLSQKTFLSLMIAIVPPMISLIVMMFVDTFPLFDIAVVISALAMYSTILSDQIQQDLRNQREIANQRASIMVLQMRPHFIYNTLMTIYSLCQLDPQKAQQITMDFTDYLRKNFNAVASETTIPFSTELDHTRAYLAVEQAQYEEMLFVEYDTQFKQFRLPPLTLQPITENAVKHGMDPSVGPLHITIRTFRKDSASMIIVEDDGTGFDSSQLNELHTTLNNIRQRLKMMCHGTLEIMPRDKGGTIVRVTIPD